MKILHLLRYLQRWVFQRNAQKLRRGDIQAHGYETGYLEAGRSLNENRLRLEAKRASRRGPPAKRRTEKAQMPPRHNLESSMTAVEPLAPKEPVEAFDQVCNTRHKT